MPQDTTHLLVLQCFLIVVPIVLYASRSTSPLDQRQNLLFSLLSISTLLLCMSEPIKFIDGNQWDLREVPMIIGTLYGGPLTGGLLYLTFAVYRVSNGGIGAIGALSINGLMMISLLALAPRFRASGRIWRISISSFVSIGTCLALLVYTSTVVHYNTEPFLRMVYLLGFVQLGAVAFLTYLIEIFETARRVEQELEHAEREKSEIVVDMAASMAHEIRTPLTTAIGFLDLLTENPTDQKKRQEYVAYGLNELRRAERVISEYLVFANVDKAAREPMDASVQLMKVVRELRSFAAEHHVGIFISKSANALVNGNEEQLRLCLHNLCENAIESMPDGGMLRVASYELPDDVVVEIEDSGRGMTHDQIVRLGKPFYSTKEKGTGLGTMLSYRIVESMGGSVTCESTRKEGTRFTIRLPKTRESASSFEVSVDRQP